MADEARRRAPGEDGPRIPLVGRQPEMTRFGQLLQRGRGGVVLYGPMGTGKTRLAEELLVVAENAGAISRFVRGRASIEDVPLGPFAPLLPVGAERVQGISLIVMARNALDELRGSTTLVLGVDDAHLLDAASASLVNQLVTGGTALIVATIRDGEWVPDPITELWRSGLVERWPIDPLKPDGVIQMAESLLDHDLSPDVADELVRLSGGNPLFVTTLARALRDSGDTDDLRVAARAPSLVDWVAARLGTLDPVDRDALALVALGEPLGLAIVEQLTDPRSLVTLERGGWLVLTEDGRRTDVRLAHPLFGEVLRSNLSRLLARAIYRELAAAVSARGARRRDDLLRVAAWSLDSGAPIATDRMLAAAEEAAHAGDFVLAERLAEVVWDAGPNFAAGVLLLDIHRSRRVIEDSAGFLAKLSSCITEPDQAAVVAAARSLTAFWRNGDLPQALQLLDDALAEVPSGDARDELVALRASHLAVCGRPDEARRLVDDVSSRASPRVLVSLAYPEQILATSYGDPRTIIARYDEIVAASAAIHNEAGIMATRIVHARICRAMVQDGQLHRAEAVIREAVEESIGNIRPAGALESNLAWVLTFRGRPGEAYGWAQRAATRQRRLGLRTLERWSAGVMAIAAAHVGDVAAAEAALALVDELSPNPATLYDVDLWRARVALAAIREDYREALRWARLIVDDSAQVGRPFDEALGWHLIARIRGPHEALEPLSAIGAQMGGLPQLFADHVRGMATDDPELFAATADRLADAGTDLIAASVAGDAARAYERAGDSKLASRWTRRAHDLLALADATGKVVGAPELESLSRREREVAELAADGLASREIAERLFLSTRTVDNHLARAYEKLGIAGRSDLADALR